MTARINRMAAEEILKETIEQGKRRTERVPDCLIWPFTRDRNGYASIAGQKTILVSRLVCEGVYGPSPKGRPLALHNCDRGHDGCIEPTHLGWGSYLKNNVEDKKRAGTLTDRHKIWHSGNGLKRQRIDLIKKYRENGRIGRELENRRGFTAPLGSNPSPSASFVDQSTRCADTKDTQ